MTFSYEITAADGVTTSGWSLETNALEVVGIAAIAIAGYYLFGRLWGLVTRWRLGRKRR